MSTLKITKKIILIKEKNLYNLLKKICQKHLTIGDLLCILIEFFVEYKKVIHFCSQPFMSRKEEKYKVLLLLFHKNCG